LAAAYLKRMSAFISETTQQQKITALGSVKYARHGRRKNFVVGGEWVAREFTYKLTHITTKTNTRALD
jgi:hypothetical protein